MTFTIENKLSAEILRKIKITAYRLKMIGKGRVVNILAEERFLVNLKPYETLEITKLITLRPNFRPSMVVVSHYKAG